MANIEALKQLRRVVENAPDDLFHMRSLVEKADCGTARCAFGWCLIDPWFCQNTEISEAVIAGRDGIHLAMNFDEAARIFDISYVDAENLFAGNLPYEVGPHDVSKAEVLDNIDWMLAGHGSFPYAVVECADRCKPDDEDNPEEEDEA